MLKDSLHRALSPDVLALLAGIGDGDLIIIGDRMFPGTTQGVPCVRLDALDCPEALIALATAIDFSNAAEHKPFLMKPGHSEDSRDACVQQRFEEVLGGTGGLIPDFQGFGSEVVAKAFYALTGKRAKVIVTGDPTPYGNLGIFKKGTGLRGVNPLLTKYPKLIHALADSGHGAEMAFAKYPSDPSTEINLVGGGTDAWKNMLAAIFSVRKTDAKYAASNDEQNIRVAESDREIAVSTILPQLHAGDDRVTESSIETETAVVYGNRKVKFTIVTSTVPCGFKMRLGPETF